MLTILQNSHEEALARPLLSGGVFIITAALPRLEVVDEDRRNDGIALAAGAAADHDIGRRKRALEERHGVARGVGNGSHGLLSSVGLLERVLAAPKR